MSEISRRKVAEYAAKKVADGGNVRQLAREIAAWLSETKNLRAEENLLRAIEAEIFAKYSHLVAEVTSARKLTENEREKIVAQLKSEMDAKTVELVEKTDENLLGGVKIRTANAEMDGSLSGKLKRLRAI